jgi:hypothetical protein
MRALSDRLSKADIAAIARIIWQVRREIREDERAAETTEASPVEPSRKAGR